MMHEGSNKRSRPSFFLMMGLIGLCAVLIGFSKTFILPVTTGSFKAPFVIYLHGAFAFSWILLYNTQTALIHLKNYRIHMTLGVLGIFIALGVAITMLPAGLYQVERALKERSGETAISGILGTCTTATIFLMLVFSGIIYRKHRGRHKRFMLLAMIVVLWPAWFRFRHYFPSVSRPDIWFSVVLADSFIVFAWIRDKLVHGKVHPVLGYFGLLIIAENTLEVLLFDSTSWRVISNIIYGCLSNLFHPVM